MENYFKNQYDIIVIGSSLFASEITVELSQTNLTILLISEKDFASDNSLSPISISDYCRNNRKLKFYNKYSHSVIPAKLYNLQSTNFADIIFTKIRSIINKKIISNKEFKQKEKSLNIASSVIIKSEDVFKQKYSRLCIDTVKTAKEQNVDILNYKPIKKIETNTIELESGKNITAELIINTDYNFFDRKLKNKIYKLEYKTFSIPRISFDIANPIRIKNKNQIDLIPYFSELFINSQNENNIDKIIAQITQNLGVEINKNTIIRNTNINTYSSDLLVDNNKVINILEFDYTKFEVKINSILDYISEAFLLKTHKYFMFKIAGSYNKNIDRHGFIRMLEDNYLQVQETGIKPNQYTILFYRYGTEIEKITEKAYDYYNNKETRKDAWLYAELWYGVNYEFVKTVEDFTERRTNFGLINQLDDEKKEIISNFIENFNNAR